MIEREKLHHLLRDMRMYFLRCYVNADAEAYRLQQEAKYVTEATIRKETIEKWDGKLPTIMSENAMPLIDAKNLMEGENHDL